MLLLEVVEPVAFDAQVLLFLSVLFCARICERCSWSVVVGPSGDVARPLLRKSEQRGACTVMSARGVAMKRPAAGTSAAVSESNLPPGASLPPPVLLPASDLESVDLHPVRSRTKKSKRKSRENLGQSVVKKKRRKPAPQCEEAVHDPGIDSGESLQPCNARARDSTQEPRVTQESVGPCANLLDSEGDIAQLGGTESSGSDARSYLRAKLDDLKVKLGGEKAMPKLPGPSGARGARASTRTESTSEVLQSLRKRLSLGDPTSENVTTKATSQEGDDAVAILAKAIRRLIKGGNNGPGSGVFGREEDEDSLEQPFLAAPARACQDLNIQARRFPGRFLADALSSMQRFLGSRVGAGTSSEELPWVLTYLETVFNQRYTKECVVIRTAREMRTLAEAIDSLLEGDSMRTADLLIQRFKALETSVSDGSWSLARHLELIPEEGVGLTSPAERDLIAKLELQRARLAEGGGTRRK